MNDLPGNNQCIEHFNLFSPFIVWFGFIWMNVIELNLISRKATTTTTTTTINKKIETKRHSNQNDDFWKRFYFILIFYSFVQFGVHLLVCIRTHTSDAHLFIHGRHTDAQYRVSRLCALVYVCLCKRKRVRSMCMSVYVRAWVYMCASVYTCVCACACLCCCVYMDGEIDR